MTQFSDQAPSGTAKLVCYVRALSHFEHGEADNLAQYLLSPQTRNRIGAAEVRRHIISRELPPALYSFIVARTRLLDRLYQQALSDGTEQVVLLGAGYDSRPYRLGIQQTGVAIFEVDAPATQHFKRRWLDAADIAIPANLTFVPIDFNYQRLADLLPLAGYSSERRTLFIWEGVTYYLEHQAVTATLQFVSENSADATSIVFDYAYQRVLHDRSGDAAAEAALSGAAAEGEPYRFGIDEGQIEHFLRKTDLRLVAHWAPDELWQLLDDDFDAPYSFIAVALAAVNRR